MVCGQRRLTELTDPRARGFDAHRLAVLEPADQLELAPEGADVGIQGRQQEVTPASDDLAIDALPGSYD